MSDPLRDVLDPRPVTTTELLHDGMIWDLVADTVDLGEQGSVRREYLRHPGAVGVLALDDDDKVLVVRQYRHPTRHELWELPAGLLDVDGEPPFVCARRELAEEGDLLAERWDVLVDWFNSPGGSDEALRLFLARGCTPVPHADRHERFHEEAGMPTRWVALDELRDGVLRGDLHNPTLVVGVLAACAARDAGWSTLRPVDAPWPEHPAQRPV